MQYSIGGYNDYLEKKLKGKARMKYGGTGLWDSNMRVFNYKSLPVKMFDNLFYCGDGEALKRDESDGSRLPGTFRFLNLIDSVSIFTDLPRRPTFYQLDYPITMEMNITEAPGSNSDKPFKEMPSTCYYVIGYIKYTRIQNGGERFVNGRYINLPGFNRPAEFYSPDYRQMTLSARPDYRHTLYWKPAVKTDAEGKAQVEFYNNAVCTELHISIEGLTKNGLMITH